MSLNLQHIYCLPALMPDEFVFTRGLRVSFFQDRTALAHALTGLGDTASARVSPALPLRVNLTALQNVALIELYRKQANAPGAETHAQALLERLGATLDTTKREADMSARERFIVLLARALMLQRARLIIDQPGALLYDEHYPALIRTFHERTGTDKTWEIYDYAWNRVLYE